jgi:hemolysin activation/secretion protein
MRTRLGHRLAWLAALGPAVVGYLPGHAGAEPAASFELDELRVEGNSVLSEREIDTVVYPFLGPGRTRDDVEHARAALEAYYGKRGYPTVSVTVPPQTPQDGVVVVNVIERPVGRLRVVGARYVTPSSIRAAAPSLAEGTVPNINAVQADIVAMNQLPDRTITPVLRAGAAPDTVDVDLKVEDKFPLHGSLSLDNRQTQDTAPLRLSGNVSYTNLWQRGDAVTFGYQVAPENPNDATVFTGSYLFHVPGSKISLLGNYIHSNSNVVALGSTDVVGKGDIFQLRVLVPLGTSDDFTHSLSAGFDYKHVTEAVGLAGAFSDTPVDYVPLSVTYQAAWVGARSNTDASATLVWGFPEFGSNDATFDAKRFDASTNFVYVKADASRTQELPYGMEAYGHIVAQVSPDPLVSNEQLSLGGVDTVRGYYESEALGDFGGAGQVELRSPSLSRYVHGQLTSVRVHAFLDAGAAAIRDPLPGQEASAALASVGVGARFRLYDHLSGAVEDAVPLHNGPVTHAGTNRVLFSLTGDF